ncbi:hypothetical protein F511_15770 [Dorcoceras hygrometricum]|nr:hypothetical protein F511_15770 [Dorcoceras hygrometricum]
MEPVGTRNFCTDLVVVPVDDRTGIPRRTVNNICHRIQIVDSISLPPPDTVVEEPVVDTETDPTVALGIPQRSPDADLVSPRSYSDSPMHFTTDDIPLSDEPTVVLPPDLTKEFAQLCASVDQISLEHVQTRVHIERLKAEFFAKISILETTILIRADNQDRDAHVQTDIFRKEMKAHKAALSEEIDVFRKEVQDQKAALSNDLMEFRVQAQKNYNTLTTQLSELVDYINRGGDAKKGEIKSRSRGPPPPDDLTRPGEEEEVEVSLRNREVLVRRVAQAKGVSDIGLEETELEEFE